MRYSTIAACLWLASCVGPAAKDADSAVGHMLDASTRALDAAIARSPFDAGAGCGLADAGRARAFYVDADGDGIGVPGSSGTSACWLEAPQGYSLVATDCDDSDPHKQSVRYGDDDHDGYGAQASAQCAPNGELAGFADLTGDCDDTSALRSPVSPEIVGDGVDQDCDGDDSLRRCVAAPGVPSSYYATLDVVPLPDLSQFVVPMRADCTGADLYFVVLGACPTCGGGELTIVVGNRGRQAASFTVTGNAGTVASVGTVAPQALSEPVVLPFDFPATDILLETTAGVVDCDSSSNQTNIETGFYDCFI